MIVSDERRLLFVHVQKTGGSTVERVLLTQLPSAVRVSGLPGGRHSTLRQVLHERPEVADYWSFGFVRNPWARMYSWHAMIMRRKRAARAGNQDLAVRIERGRFWGGVVARYPTFESFVMAGPDEFTRIGRPQLNYLRAGGREVDFIGRTEQLDVDLRRVADTLGLELSPAIERTNAGPPADYRQHYTPQMRERVGELYALDIDRFGYSF